MILQMILQMILPMIIVSGVSLASMFDWSLSCYGEIESYFCGGIMKESNQSGKIGYIILWFLGVPASVLILIALLRSC